jgi:hypothetical protein
LQLALDWLRNRTRTVEQKDGDLLVGVADIDTLVKEIERLIPVHLPRRDIEAPALAAVTVLRARASPRRTTVTR